MSEYIKLYGYLVYLPSFKNLSLRAIAELKENFEKSKVSNHKTVLFGNGHPGKKIMI